MKRNKLRAKNMLLLTFKLSSMINVFRYDTVMVLSLWFVGVSELIFPQLCYSQIYGTFETTTGNPDATASGQCKMTSDAECTYKKVGNIVQTCCSEPYVPGIYNCQNFAARCQMLCNRDGISCKTLGAECRDKAGNSLGSPHRFNMVWLPETKEWCLVEPQGGLPICAVKVSSIYKLPDTPDLCKLWQQNGWDPKNECATCQVDISGSGKIGEVIPPVTDTYGCAKNSWTLWTCNNCCDGVGKNFSWTPERLSECKNSCMNYHSW